MIICDCFANNWLYSLLSPHLHLHISVSLSLKAKAAGAALAFLGLITSGFSIFAAVLAGGAAIYAAKLPEEGDKGVSDTAKQVSLLVGTYTLKAFDFVKKKDAEEGISKKLISQVKEGQILCVCEVCVYVCVCVSVCVYMCV